MIASKSETTGGVVSTSHIDQDNSIDIFAGLTLPGVPSHAIILNQPLQTTTIQSQEVSISSVPNNTQTQQNLVDNSQSSIIDEFSIFHQTPSASQSTQSHNDINMQNQNDDVTSISDYSNSLPNHLSKLYTTVEDSYYSQNSKLYPDVPNIDSSVYSSKQSSSSSQLNHSINLSTNIIDNVTNTEEIIRNMNSLVSNEVTG